MATVTDPGAYVRDHYQVPAHIDGRITFTWRGRRTGTIVGFESHRLEVLLDGESEPAVLHPTWNIQYHPRRGDHPMSTDPAQARIDGLAVDLAEERAERRKTWLWECGCLINDGDAHRVGCPVYPEGRAARWG
jgi:hypothetical protein